MTLRVSSIEEKPMEASKWLSVPVLLDLDEMQALFETLGSFLIFQTSRVLKKGEGEISKQEFLNSYREYIDDLKAGRLPDESKFRGYFSSVLTRSTEMLYTVPLPEEKQLIRVAQPVVQLQSHHMNYSPADGKFHSMTFGSDSIMWGICFSYPQLYKELISQEVFTVKDTPAFPNTSLFHALQRWIRHHTLPTPILVEEGHPLNLSVRLGKQCLSWINHHPQLIQKNFRILHH